jgi:hypothetical protein
MGCASSAALGISPAKEINKVSMQDEARSFRSKTGALKILLRQDGSRKAFQVFLRKAHQQGQEELVDYYITLEVIKRIIDKKEARQRSQEVIAQYQARAEKKESAAILIYETLHSWKGVDKLTDDELRIHMGRSAEEVMGILSPLFEQFVASKDYVEWTKEETKLERRHSITKSDIPDMSGYKRQTSVIRTNSVINQQNK